MARLRKNPPRSTSEPLIGLGAALDADIGDRSKLADSLLLVPTKPDDPVRKLINLLADPANDRRRIADLCEEAGVGIDVVYDHFRRAVLARAQLRATRSAAHRVGEVVDDVFNRAVEHDAVCEKCGGSGKRDTRFGIQACPYCSQGKIRRNPDHAVQRTALEIGQIISQGPGISVNVNQTTNELSLLNFGRSFKQFQVETDRLLYPQRQLAPADEPKTVVVEADPPPDPS